jgi:hypothetical protein
MNEMILLFNEYFWEIALKLFRRLNTFASIDTQLEEHNRSAQFKTTMKHIAFLIILISQMSCTLKKTLNIKSDDIDSVEVYKGFPGSKIEMKEGFENDLIVDLNNSKELGPTKYGKTHRILIHYKDQKIDTIYTNGIIHNFKGWYKSEDNLIEKYTLK